MFSPDFILDSFEPHQTSETSLPEVFLIVDARQQYAIFQKSERIWFGRDELDALLKTWESSLYANPVSVGRDNSFRYKVAIVQGVKACGDFDFNLGEFRGLRDLMNEQTSEHFAVTARATLLARWQIEHRYCGRCGSRTREDHIDPARACHKCRLRFYPRISPCMIALIIKGDQVLLAHHKRATKPVYSPLAGFIEAGETAEEAVAREVFEEVGIKIKNIRYFSSQSWPFPSQLMLAFFADYESGELLWNSHEITDAQWFSLDQLPMVPSPQSIAGRLLSAAKDIVIKESGGES